MIELIEANKISDDLIQEFKLVKEDILYECYLDNKKIGYAIIQNKRNDRIFIVVAKKYQNQGYGSIIFKLLISKLTESVICSVPLENIKMQRIVQKNNGVEIGRNGNTIQYNIEIIK